MSRVTVRCAVTGRVQGVFYRASTCDRASALGVDGWVRNLPDGRVELVASGPAGAVETLVAWLWQGPPAAEVHQVSVESWDDPVEPGFHVRS